jgi:hypothetical protein
MMIRILTKYIPLIIINIFGVKDNQKGIFMTTESTLDTSAREAMTLIAKMPNYL